MKVAIIGSFMEERFGRLISDSLKALGHETVEIDPELKVMEAKLLGKRINHINATLYKEVFYKIPQIRRRKSKEIYKQVKNSAIDLTLVLHDFLNEEEVSQIKRLTKAPIVLWFPDAIINFRKSMFFTAGYDRLFFKDKYIVERLNSDLCFDALYLPQCCSPVVHKKAILSQEDREYYACEITNAGNLYPSRAALYRKLMKYDIKLWGATPPIWLDCTSLEEIIMGKEVYGEEKSKAFSAAKIVLNNFHPAEINGMNKRTFEIAACGGFQICSHRPVASELFDLDREIVCYRNFDELIEKIEYFLDPSHEEERKGIIEAGRKRALEEHTYKHRLNQLIETVF